MTWAVIRNRGAKILEMQTAYERGEEKVKVLDEITMTGVVRRAGCVCHSGSKDTHKYQEYFSAIANV